jgi:hypothetical protein
MATVSPQRPIPPPARYRSPSARRTPPIASAPRPVPPAAAPTAASADVVSSPRRCYIRGRPATEPINIRAFPVSGTAGGSGWPVPPRCLPCHSCRAATPARRQIGTPADRMKWGRGMPYSIGHCSIPVDERCEMKHGGASDRRVGEERRVDPRGVDGRPLMDGSQTERRIRHPDTRHAFNSPSRSKEGIGLTRDHVWSRATAGLLPTAGIHWPIARMYRMLSG